MKTNLDNDSQ